MPIRSNRLVLAGLMLVAAHGGVAQAQSAQSSNDVSAVVPGQTAVHANEHITVLEGDILSGPRMMSRGIGVQSGVAVWEDGVVPYYIDPELQPFVVDIVEKAITTWNRAAGVSLVAINPFAADSPRDYIHFTPASGCASWIGRQGGAQAIWTAPSCSAGSMMHEIGHALGLEHEHTRPDRDQHIAINWENISPEKASNFDISTSDKQYYGAYDYASIMHYGEFFFSANGGSTIQPLNAAAGEIGQRVAPSAGDIKAITMLYSSDISLVSNVVNEAGRTEVSLLVTNEYAQGANQLEIELQIGSAKLLSNSSADWQCATYDGRLICLRDRLQGDTQSKFILELDQVLTEVQLDPRLATKTPDENMQNNSGVFSPAAANLNSTESSELLYSDEQLDANAGSAGVWMFGILMLMLGARREKSVVLR